MAKQVTLLAIDAADLEGITQDVDAIHRDTRRYLQREIRLGKAPSLLACFTPYRIFKAQSRSGLVLQLKD